MDEHRNLQPSNVPIHEKPLSESYKPAVQPDSEEPTDDNLALSEKGACAPEATPPVR